MHIGQLKTAPRPHEHEWKLTVAELNERLFCDMAARLIQKYGTVDVDAKHWIQLISYLLVGPIN